MRTATLLIPGTTVFVLIAALPASADLVVVNPASGAVVLEQIDFRDEGAGGTNSNVGNISAIRPDLLGLLPPGATGYVNVTDNLGGWLVRNLVVPPPSSSEFDRHIMRFALPNPPGANLLSLDVRVTLADSPQSSPPLGPTSPWTIGDTVFAAGGVDGTLHGFLSPPDVSNLAFRGTETWRNFEQRGHPNIQTARNQCAPAAIANSLDWLRSRFGIPVPHANNPGLRGDNTLVGRLDQAMYRDVTLPPQGRPPPPGGWGPRQKGDGVWPFDGKLKYLSENNLGGALVLKHQGSGGMTGGKPPQTQNVILNGAQNVTRYGITSQGRGATVSWNWLCSELKRGEDVEIDLAYLPLTGTGDPIGRHYVELVGCGMVNGEGYIKHVSDGAQTDWDPLDRSLGANDGLVQDYLKGDRAVNSWAWIDQALSQSPEPATAALLLPAAWLVVSRSNRRGNRRHRSSPRWRR